MKKLIVALFSTYLGVYDVPQFSDARDDDDLKESYRRAILSDPDGAYHARAQEKALCKLGEFDDFTGKITVFPEPIKILDLAALFPAGYLMKKEAFKNE